MASASAQQSSRECDARARLPRSGVLSPRAHQKSWRRLALRPPRRRSSGSVPVTISFTSYISSLCEFLDLSRYVWVVRQSVRCVRFVMLIFCCGYSKMAACGMCLPVCETTFVRKFSGWSTAFGLVGMLCCGGGDAEPALLAHVWMLRCEDSEFFLPTL